MKQTKLQRFADLAAKLERDSAIDSTQALTHAKDGFDRMSEVVTERAVMRLHIAAEIRGILS